MILMFISMERYVLISAPLKGNRTVTPRFAKTSMFVVWLLGLTFAVFPGEFELLILIVYNELACWNHAHKNLKL